MTDAHFHRNGFPALMDAAGREVRFFGVHPWEADALGADALAARLAETRAALEADPSAGVGETGLDRLRSKTVSDVQCAAFEAQLGMAAELRRPVVLHGAKCWGRVVAACRPYAGRIPAFLFHGFSRSAGLLPEIFAMNGYVSVGPAVANPHAANYREMVKNLPEDRIMVETDADRAVPGGAEAADVAAALAEVRGERDAAAFEAAMDANARAFALASGAVRW